MGSPESDLNRYLDDCAKQDSWDEAVEERLDELLKDCLVAIVDTADGSKYPWTWIITDSTGKLLEEDGAETKALAEKAAQSWMEQTAESDIQDRYEQNQERDTPNERDYE